MPDKGHGKASACYTSHKVISIFFYNLKIFISLPISNSYKRYAFNCRVMVVLTNLVSEVILFISCNQV